MGDPKVTLISDLGGRDVCAEFTGEQVLVTIERSYLSPQLVSETLCGISLDPEGAAQLGERLQVFVADALRSD